MLPSFVLVILFICLAVFGVEKSIRLDFVQIPNGLVRDWDTKCMILEGELRTCLEEVSGNYSMHNRLPDRTFVVQTRDKSMIDLNGRDSKLSACLGQIRSNITIVISNGASVSDSDPDDANDDLGDDSDESISDASFGDLDWLDRLI